MRTGSPGSTTASRCTSARTAGNRGSGRASLRTPRRGVLPAADRLRGGEFAQYGVGPAVVGDIAAHTAAGEALRDLAREGNRGRDFRFVRDLDEVRDRLRGPRSEDRTSRA
ncbi:DUF4180 domain-containing protein [Streptomyces sp. NPDC002133]|uniref:DUF4180 domain-containing protein n=1 Tax=Streptomyces sp. NPDC002133 TaxID=3154409 RepID=UPI003323E8B7